jgi:hypothetical protein
MQGPGQMLGPGLSRLPLEHLTRRESLRRPTDRGGCTQVARAGAITNATRLSDYACYDCVKEADGITPQRLRASKSPLLLPSAPPLPRLLSYPFPTRISRQFELTRTCAPVFLGKNMACENPAANAMLLKSGLTYLTACDNPAKAVPECFVAANWNHGWICEASAEIFSNLGYELVALTRANFTQASADLYKGGSSYTRCIYEIIAGNVDICVSDFWQTTERSKIISFTTGVDSDTMMLVTMPVGGAASLVKKTFSYEDITLKNILGIFGPFVPEVWAVTVAFFAFGGILLWAVEGIGQGNPEYKEKYENPTYATIGGLVIAVYSGIMDYWLAGPTFLTVTSWPGRICVLGYGFFVFMTCTSYTANLVSFMSTVSVPPKAVKSLDHLVEIKVCVCVCVCVCARARAHV